MFTVFKCYENLATNLAYVYTMKYVHTYTVEPPNNRQVGINFLSTICFYCGV